MSVAQLFRRLPEDAPPQTLAQQVHDQAGAGPGVRAAAVPKWLELSGRV